ncbi:MAG: triose-phosphate isomerase [Waddliaceae bacterium]|nr:triose-phosphate isomerase [Waddliaceae bacterium]
MGRETIVAGNWKMYKTSEEAVAFIDQLKPLIENVESSVYLAVPFTAIHPSVEASKNSKICIGAQNMHDATEGAFTGEVAGCMLSAEGTRFVILGHSERRHVFGESSQFVNAKVKAALKEGLRPIVCVGEQKTEREQGKTEEIIEQQMIESLSDLSEDDMKTVVIAYEPVWAIGTGLTATPELAQEAHQFIRGVLSKNWTDKVAKGTPILYGGSVKPKNARELTEGKDIDGVLVGGAALDVQSFFEIIEQSSSLSAKAET